MNVMLTNTIPQATPAPVVSEPPAEPLPIAVPNQHPVDIVPEASTASGPDTVGDVKPEPSLPIVEILPAQDALPETAPVEVPTPTPAAEPEPEPAHVPTEEPLAGPAKAAIESPLITDKVEVPVSESVPTKVDEVIEKPSAPTTGLETSVAPVQDKPTEPAPEKPEAVEAEKPAEPVASKPATPAADKPVESTEGKPAARASSGQFLPLNPIQLAYNATLKQTLSRTSMV